MLDETLPQKTDIHQDPYQLTIEFPGQKKVGFDFLTHVRNKDKVAQVAEYFQIILNKSIRLELKLKEDLDANKKRREQTSRQSSPDYYYILDKEKNPLIEQMEELFQTEFQFSRPIQVETDTLTKETPDEYAEDA